MVTEWESGEDLSNNIMNCVGYTLYNLLILKTIQDKGYFVIQDKCMGIFHI